MTPTAIKNKKNPERPAGVEGNFYEPKTKQTLPGMNDRIRRLRKQSVETQESLSIERALITTRFYRENAGKIFRSDDAGTQFHGNLQTKNHLLSAKTN